MTIARAEENLLLEEQLKEWGVRETPEFVEGFTSPDGLERVTVVYVSAPRSLQIIIRYKWSIQRRGYLLDGGYQRRRMKSSRARRDLPTEIWDVLAKRAIARGWRPTQTLLA